MRVSEYAGQIIVFSDCVRTAAAPLFGAILIV